MVTLMVTCTHVRHTHPGLRRGISSEMVLPSTLGLEVAREN